ncbi:hypothetical protein BH10PSE12_BH10PSE12_02910 [soil metagenome]
MSWFEIKCVKPSNAKSPAVPVDGLLIKSAVVGARKKAGETEGRMVRYIKMRIGSGLAKKLCLVGESTRLALALGGGKFAGQISMAVDATAGGFPAAKQKDGGYTLTINEASADGLFSFGFAAFAAQPSALPATTGAPPMYAFTPPSAFLAASADA